MRASSLSAVFLVTFAAAAAAAPKVKPTHAPPASALAPLPAGCDQITAHLAECGRRSPGDRLFHVVVAACGPSKKVHGLVYEEGVKLVLATPVAGTPSKSSTVYRAEDKKASFELSIESGFEPTGNHRGRLTARTVRGALKGESLLCSLDPTWTGADKNCPFRKAPACTSAKKSPEPIRDGELRFGVARFRDKDGKYGTGALSVPREERDRAARYTAMGTLRDPTIHAAILKGLHDACPRYDMDLARIKAACEKGAHSIEKAELYKHLTDAAGQMHPCTNRIEVDGERAERTWRKLVHGVGHNPGENFVGSITQVLIHEGLHVCFYEMGIDAGHGIGDDHHALMDGLTGITWWCAKGKVPTDQNRQPCLELCWEPGNPCEKGLVCKHQANAEGESVSWCEPAPR